jgi:hypothetical protein
MFAEHQAALQGHYARSLERRLHDALARRACVLVAAAVDESDFHCVTGSRILEYGIPIGPDVNGYANDIPAKVRGQMLTGN